MQYAPNYEVQYAPNYTPIKESHPCEYWPLGCTTQICGINLHRTLIYFPNLHRPDKPGVLMHIMMKYLGNHFTDVIMSAMASQITSISIVCSTVGPGADQREHQSPASLAFARGIHRWPVSSCTKANKYSLLMHCIKIKSPAKFLLNEQYVFVGGNISFLCVLSPKRHSQLDYELNGL